MGYVYIGRYDIKAFYGSFDPDELSSELPVPKSLVDRRRATHAGEDEGREEVAVQLLPFSPITYSPDQRGPPGNSARLDLLTAR
jgi:hypothetical protein